MEQATHKRRPMNPFERLPERVRGFLGTVADVLGIAGGISWLSGFLPGAPGWMWPAATVCAVVATALALGRMHQLVRERDELNEAYNGLMRVATRTHLELLKTTLEQAEAVGELPITGMAAYLATLRPISKEPAGVDEALAALSEYEHLMAKQRMK